MLLPTVKDEPKRGPKEFCTHAVPFLVFHKDHKPGTHYGGYLNIKA